MDPRRLIQEIPTDALLAMVELLTNGRADPQFVRAAAMDIKRKADDTQLRASSPADDIACR